MWSNVTSWPLQISYSLCDSLICSSVLMHVSSHIIRSSANWANQGNTYSISKAVYVTALVNSLLQLTTKITCQKHSLGHVKRPHLVDVIACSWGHWHDIMTEMGPAASGFNRLLPAGKQLVKERAVVYMILGTAVGLPYFNIRQQSRWSEDGRVNTIRPTVGQCMDIKVLLCHLLRLSINLILLIYNIVAR